MVLPLLGGWRLLLFCYRHHKVGLWSCSRSCVRISANISSVEKRRKRTTWRIDFHLREFRPSVYGPIEVLYFHSSLSRFLRLILNFILLLLFLFFSWCVLFVLQNEAIHLHGLWFVGGDGWTNGGNSKWMWRKEEVSIWTRKYLAVVKSWDVIILPLMRNRSLSGWKDPQPATGFLFGL